MMRGQNSCGRKSKFPEIGKEYSAFKMLKKKKTEYIGAYYFGVRYDFKGNIKIPLWASMLR